MLLLKNMLSPEKFIHHCCIFFLFGLFWPSPVFSAELVSPPPIASKTGKKKNQILVPWYGNIQYFGTPGLAQRWINILGHVEPQTAITSLTYSLNRGPERQLNIGPDSRRLSRSGDFNIDIETDKLQPGTNIVQLSAQAKDGSLSQLDISIQYRKKKWPLPYKVEWQAVKNIQKAVQVVDGLWQLTDQGLRTSPHRIGYDRSFSIGDSDWSSFEVQFPLTVHRIDHDAYESPESVKPGFGIISHWSGHTDSPVRCIQPHCGWLPSGAQNWYFFGKNDWSGLNIITEPLPSQSAVLPYNIIPGTTYILRARVEKKPFRNLYFMKLWKQSEPEPVKWSLRRSDDAKNIDHGGLLIVAHHVDMTIGDIEVQPVASQKVTSAKDLEKFWQYIKEYLVPLPLLITLIAGAIIIMRGTQKKGGFSQKLTVVTGLAITGLLIIFLVEPFFPDILHTFALNSKMTAALYLGLDWGRTVLQTVIWLMIILFFMQTTKK
jgi:hypothetical protein